MGIGVIGAGFHSRTNILPSFVRAGLNVDALATRDAARSAEALRRFGFDGTPYGSAADLLADPTITAVVVVAQPEDQARLTMEALQAGKHVLADKPLGWTAAEALALAEAADAADRMLMVGFMKRYAPIYRQLRELLRSGELGSVHGFESTFGCDSTPFCANAEQFVKLAAIHVIDLVRFLFGDISRVRVSGAGAGSHVHLAILLDAESSPVGTMSLSGLPGYTSETERLVVTGSRGHAIADNLTRLSVHVTDHGEASWRSLTERTEVFTPAFSAMSGSDQDLFQRGFVGQLQHFSTAITTGAAIDSNGRDNAETMALCEAILSEI